jgi:hypothetical protein
MARLLAALKPRFRSQMRSLASGNSRATISAVPSREALSTTLIVAGRWAG